MTRSPPNGYNRLQIELHWLVFALVAFLFFTGDNTTDAFRAHAALLNAPWLWIHLLAGLAVAAFMLWRLRLRASRGAPPPPADEAPALRLLALGVHWLLYIDLIGAALIGLLAMFWLPGLAGLHETMTRLALLVLVGLHIAGAFAHQFYWRDNVLMRMLRPAPD